MIPVLMNDNSKGIEKCPLGCGWNWHGLPKGQGTPSYCPSPWGVPAPTISEAELAPVVPDVA